MAFQFNPLAVNPNRLAFRLRAGDASGRIDPRVYFRNEAAIEYLYKEVIPHFIHLYKNDDEFLAYTHRIGAIDKFIGLDEADFLITKITFLHLVFEEAIKNTKGIWLFDDTNFLLDNILRFHMKLSDVEIESWKLEQDLAKQKVS